MSTYSPQAVANYFLQKAAQDGYQVTQMKLMKLVYIGFGWALALLDRELFSDRIEAWQHGPVIPSLYHEFKHFGARPITELAMEFDLDSLDSSIPEIPEEDQDARLVLEKVWGIYKGFSANALRAKTHEDNTPWKAVWNEDERNIEIPRDLIGPHFKRKIQSYLNG